MIDWDSIKQEFVEKYAHVPGVVSIDLSQNLIRVLLINESVIEEESLPPTFRHDPQDYEIGIEYDTLDRVEARKAFAEKDAAIRELLKDANASTPD